MKKTYGYEIIFSVVQTGRKSGENNNTDHPPLVHRKDPMDNNRLFRTAALLVSLAAGCFLLRTVPEQLMGILLPVLAAWGASAAVRPAVLFLSRKTGIRPKICGGAVTFLVFFAVGYLLLHLSGRLAEEISSFVSEMDTVGGDIRRFLRDLREKLPLPAGFFDSSVYDAVIAALQEAAVSFGGKLTSFLTSLCTALPGSVLSVFVCAASFYYLTCDRDGAAESFCALFPASFLRRIRIPVRRACGALSGYLRAYLLLMAITFFELLLGLSVLGVRYVFVISFLISVVDALPVLGAGAVMGPWAAAAFIRGNSFLGTGLLILLGVMYVVRQMLEPRLIGRFIGVHPMIALAAVFAGYRLCGFFGMIASPVLLYTVRAAAGTENAASGG